MMQHAWDGYEKYAWGKNEVRPVSLRGHSASIFGSSSMGASIVDALDTLYIMGMTEEYQRARQWVEENLDVNKMVKYYTKTSLKLWTKHKVSLTQNRHLTLKIAMYY